MRTWTVVIEVHDDNENPLTKEQIESVIVNPCLPYSIGYQIFECTEAAYGPGPENVMLRDGERRLKPIRHYKGVPR